MKISRTSVYKHTYIWRRKLYTQQLRRVSTVDCVRFESYSPESATSQRTEGEKFFPPLYGTRRQKKRRGENEEKKAPSK